MLDDLPLLAPLLSAGIDRLHSLSIKTNLITSPPVHNAAFDEFNDEFGLTIPDDVQNLYLETNGFMISWEASDEWGQLQFPSLAELRLHRQRWVNGEMPTKLHVSHLPGDVGAELLRQMRVWLPFDESGSGDLMCIDCDSGWVVKYDHEWGNPTERNGSVFATSLTNYIRECSNVCFHNVWLAGFDQIARDQNCWTDWSSGNISKRYLIRS